MRAMAYTEHGPPSNIRPMALDVPELGPHDALIKVHAVSLNGFDPMMLQGETELKTPFPMVPGGDFAGEIVALGDKAHIPDPDVPDFMSLFPATRWKVGARVLPFPFVMGEGMTGETRRGACCEYMRMPVANLVPIPDAVSYEDAAALPIAYGTAYRMMVTNGKVRSGETVLVLGATGGVGTCAVQLAKAAGATVIASGRGADRTARLKDIGADHIINTEEDDLIARCHEIAGKPRMLVPRKGVDMVINYIGGSTWAQASKVIAHGGRMLTCGASAGYEAATDLRYVWTYEQQLSGSNGWYPGDQLLVLGLVERGALKPVIHAIRPMEEVADAIQELMDRNVFGKIILKP